MKAQVLSIDGCPHAAVATSRVHDAADRAGVQVAVEQVRVSSAEVCLRLAFAGSPTILLDGVDPFAGDVVTDLACRVYLTAQGIQGLTICG